MKGNWLALMSQEENHGIYKNQKPSTNSLDQRQPLTTKQCFFLVFDEAHENSPMFKVFWQYMRTVLEMLTFIRAVRTADWELHLKSLEIFTKYFFAHDRLNYARMIPFYLAEMKALANRP